MSNKNRNFIGQIANKENRTRYYVVLSEELDNLKARAKTSPHADNEEDAPSDAAMHYDIPKTTSVTRDLTEFLIEYQGDRATHVSHWIHQQVSQYTHTD